MTTDADIAAPFPPQAVKKGPGRPRSAPENPQQRIERLQAELHIAHEALKIVEQHRAMIVGAAVVRHARADEDFRHLLAPILRAEIKAKADLAAIADLLTDPPPP